MQEKISKIDLTEKEAIIMITLSHILTFFIAKWSSAQGFLFALSSDDTVPHTKINEELHMSMEENGSPTNAIDKFSLADPQFSMMNKKHSP